MISVRENICGENYRKLVEFAFDHSDAAMMVFDEDYMPPVLFELREKLKPYLIYTRSDEDVSPENPFFDWPGTRCCYCDPFSIPNHFRYPEKLTHVDTYALSPEVRSFILSVDGFFNWWPGKMPQDLSFFKNGECWLYNTAHEYTLAFCDHDDEVTAMLDEMGIEYQRYRPRTGVGYIEPYMK